MLEQALKFTQLETRARSEGERRDEVVPSREFSPRNFPCRALLRDGGAVRDETFAGFLQWALPRLGLRWAGFRRVRRQVEKRIGRRIRALGLPGVAAYRARLEADPASPEWQVLRAFCAVTISRFHRDRAVWEALRDEVLPAVAAQAIAQGDAELGCWSLGCASGEEPYTLAIVWALAVAPRFPELRLRIVATDAGAQVLARARTAEYEAATLRELPPSWREQAFEPSGTLLRLRDPFRSAVELRCEDVREALPPERFRLILCRNLVFTYFDELQRNETLDRILTRLEPGGFLVAGRRETPPRHPNLEPWLPDLGIHVHRPRLA